VLSRRTSLPWDTPTVAVEPDTALNSGDSGQPVAASQGFVRSPLVVDLLEALQSRSPLRQRLRATLALDRFCQRPMETLHFPLRLWMAHSPEVQADPLLDQSYPSHVSP